ncbi:MAG: 6-phosphofructokinase [Verrucomicrobia bacterium]|nr:6-phosphofructokinase [Verrucomicrobiota bacterium]MBV9299847.1 6-phosphofructokinase [Verrucomicrobiota bacterium]MBV9643207.1 6-phosphofructokinase [Verrucomicrobiota bacterium]
MKRIGILTAGGDTPTMNATIQGAVVRANQLKIEILGLIKGFNSLFNPRVPHVHLNPLYQEIPEMDPTKGGTMIGSSRDYVDPNKTEELDIVAHRLERLRIEGLICVGGDGTLNGLQPLAERLPTVLAPKTIDNDLGLNYPEEPNEWVRVHEPQSKNGYHYEHRASQAIFDLDYIVNYVTPGYATAVYVSASGVERIRTTAESHRRIAIIEVMGRHSGYIALGSAYGRPDIILVPEHPLNIEHLVERVKQLYDLQKNVVIVCGEGIVDEQGNELGAETRTSDPAGNIALSGAAEALRHKMIHMIGDRYFQLYRRGESAREAIFTRKVGHTQRGGRPIVFDRFYAAQLGAKAVELLLEGRNNAVSILQYTGAKGFQVNGYDANRFRDRWGHIHARRMFSQFYDPIQMKPSRLGINYLLPIFTDAIGDDDMEHIRRTLFAPGNLAQPYHSINTDINKRIRYLEEEK